MLIISNNIFILTKVIYNKNEELSDYKFFCFDGLVKCFKIDFGRFTEHHANYYDPNGRILPWGETHFPPKPDAQIVIPPNLSEMIVIAERISKGKSFVRVDLYNSMNHIYFGEITFFPASGMGKFTDKEIDYELGSWIMLPEKRMS